MGNLVSEEFIRQIEAVTMDSLAVRESCPVQIIHVTSAPKNADNINAFRGRLRDAGVPVDYAEARGTPYWCGFSRSDFSALINETLRWVNALCT
jgi:hypothetical protein